MTTPAAEKLYQAQHEYETEGKGHVVFNPHGKPYSELPVIYGFNNGGSTGWWTAVSIAEDGECLGSHICSHEVYMPADLGIIEGYRTDRHTESYQKHYPDGYRMEWVPSANLKEHEKLNKAFALNKIKAEAAAVKKEGA